ncbi:hypothetical protein EZMO1_3492 [Endozoicomonas montiporae CL-33]|nr:hypothetical protein EZMO1_3492 [Endozoicomonas montiporae CL-33]
MGYPQLVNKLWFNLIDKTPQKTTKQRLTESENFEKNTNSQLKFRQLHNCFVSRYDARSFLLDDIYRMLSGMIFVGK